MKIAVACDGLNASPHAAHCESFMVYTVDKGIITACRNLPNPGVSEDKLPALLESIGASALLTEGIDMDSAEQLCYAGIEVVAGPKGAAQDLAKAYLSHTLIGVDSLCTTYHALDSDASDDAYDDDNIDAAFAHIEEEFAQTAH